MILSLLIHVLPSIYEKDNIFIIFKASFFFGRTMQAFAFYRDTHEYKTAERLIAKPLYYQSDWIFWKLPSFTGCVTLGYLPLCACIFI